MFKGLFTSSRTSQAEASTLRAIQSDFAGLLIQPSLNDLRRGFESWAWLGPPKVPPLFVSAFGDAFFERSGRVLMLDTLEGKLVPVARSIGELRRKLDETEAQDSLLSSVWIQAAQRRGIVLEPGECYDWKVAPALGGPISADAIVKLSFVVKVNVAGQLHGQIKGLPPGTKINRVTISE